MAGLAEPPANLDDARRGIDELGNEVEDVGRWRSRPDGSGWFLTLVLVPTGLDPAGPIPARTTWCVLVDKLYPGLGQVTMWPAKDGGLTETFAHQLPNGPGNDNEPWRAGQMCVTSSVFGHKRTVAKLEPKTAYDRLAWNLSLGLDWLRRASRNELIRGGDPFELPFFGQRHPGGIQQVAFFEGPETFATWESVSATEGLVELATMPDRNGLAPWLVTIRWLDLNKAAVLVPSWGRRISDLRPDETGVWLRFNRVLVRPQWKAPQTWAEIREFAAENEPAFDDRLRAAVSHIRDGRPHYLLLGFPIPKLMGEEPSVMAWAASRLPRLEPNRDHKVKAKSARAKEALWEKDCGTGPLADDKELKWLWTENWHPDELATRGRFDNLCQKKVLLIGAGALGSILGETLVRAGVRDITVVDHDVLVAGNLVRHRLTLDDLGRSKARQLADRLNALSPTASAEGLHVDLGPDSASAEKVARADVVIDTTGDDLVPLWLATDDQTSERIYVSASLSYAAEKLYFFIGRGIAFPMDDFEDQLKPWLDQDEHPIEDFPLVATGCFDPVFPARVDDIELFAAIAARQIDSRLGQPVPAPTLMVYERHLDGTVGTAAVPESIAS